MTSSDSPARGTFDIDFATGTVHLDPTYARILGATDTPDEPVDTWLARFHPVDEPAVRGALAACEAGTRGSWQFEVEQRPTDGTTHWLRLTAVVVADQPGDRRVAGACEDLSAMQARGRSRHPGEALLLRRIDARDALQSNSQTILYALANKDGLLAPTAVSANITRLIGYTPAEALTPEWWIEHVHPDDREAALSSFARLGTEDDVTHEYRFQRKDGTDLWVEDTARVVRRAGRVASEIVGAWTDISRRRQTDQALRDSEARLRLALVAADQGLWDLDVPSDQATTSPEYARMLGIDPAGFQESTPAWAARLHPDDFDRCTALWADFINGKIASYSAEFRQRHTNGSWVWVHSAGRIVGWDGFGRPSRVLGIHTNITTRKLAELRAARLSRLNAAFARCNEAIIHSRSADELFPKVCEIAVRLGGASMAWVGLADRITGQVEPAAAYGEGTAYLRDIDISVFPDEPSGQGPTGTVIRENRSIWVDDFSHDASTAPWHARAQKYGWAASGSLPLTRGGRAIASLTLYSQDAGVFDEDVRSVLTDLASDISFALDMYEQDERRREAEQRFRAIFRDSSLPSLLIDPATGALMDANQAAASLYGWSVDELRLMGLEDISTLDPDQIRENLRQFGETGSGRLRVRHRLRDGSLREVYVYTTHLVVDGHAMNLAQVFELSADGAAPAQDAGAN